MVKDGGRELMVGADRRQQRYAAKEDKKMGVNMSLTLSLLYIYILLCLHSDYISLFETIM